MVALFSGSHHIRVFKVRDYNFNVFKTVNKDVERTKMSFEMEFCVTALSNTRLKQLCTAIDENFRRDNGVLYEVKNQDTACRLHCYLYQDV